MTTFVLIGVFIALVAISILLWAYLLSLGLRLAGAQDRPWWKVFFATILIYYLLMLPLAIYSALSADSPADPYQAHAASGWSQMMPDIIRFLVGVLVSCFVISRLFKLKFHRAFLAWLLTCVSSIIMLFVVLFITKPFLIDFYSIPTNSMGPTLCGWHVQGTCTECGGRAIGSPHLPYRYSRQDEPADRARLMICESCYRMNQIVPTDDVIHAGDKMIVARYLKPKRWDIVVFRFPEDPSATFVKRLVGMPGETVVIEDGSVWIDGERLSPPESIRGIEYLAGAHESEKVESIQMNLSGTRQNPAKLGDDQYFVLGDFSARARDSRYWERSSPGRPSYAVPREDITGVVTHIYWPPSRVRVLK